MVELTKQRTFFYLTVKLRLYSRLGYILECLKIKNKFKTEYQKKILNTYVKLNPGKSNNKEYNKK